MTKSKQVSGVTMVKDKWDKDYALNKLKQIDQKETLTRIEIHEFEEKGGAKLLGFKSTRECFKTHIVNSTLSTLYRYLQCGQIEKAINAPIGFHPLTAILALRAYDENDQKSIYTLALKNAENEKISMGNINDAILCLAEEGSIKVVEKSATPLRVPKFEEVKKSFERLSFSELEELKRLIEIKLDEQKEEVG